MTTRPWWTALGALLACGGAQDRVIERTIEGRAEVEVEEIPVREGRATTEGGAEVNFSDPGTFPRDQPRVRDMVRWNGTILVEADRPYVVDAAAAEAHPLTLPGADEVLAVASQGPAAIALVRRASERLLLVTAGDRWVDRPLPEPLRAPDGPALILAADAASVAVLAPDRLHRLRGSTWTNVAVGPRPREMRGGPSRALLAGDRLYLGWDSGEWGGALLVLDAVSGRWSVGPDAGTPVKDIERAPDGAVWVANGLAHLEGRRGALYRHDGTTWTRVAASSSAQHEPNHGWTLPPDSFQSIAFAPDGSLHVLTGTMGVVRREPGGTFHQRSRGWPSARYLWVQALELQGDLAVIASEDAGVWLWDLAAHTLERVALRGAR